MPSNINALSGLIPLGFDPPISNRFLFEVDGHEIGIFRDVKGLEFSVEMESIPEGGQNQYVHQVPTRMKWSNITFSRGLTMSNELFTWMEESAGEAFAGNHNKLHRYTGAITSIDAIGIRLRSWSLRDVVPVRWKGPSFASNGDKEPLTEELEITHNGFTSETLPGKPPALGAMLPSDVLPRAPM